jgi:hypothetical protein
MNNSREDQIRANTGLWDYLTCALWSTSDNTTDQGGDPLDKNYTVQDFSDDALDQAEKDWNTFKQRAGYLLNGLNMEQVGHDFWLTRNGHGAGFWDGDYEESIGNELTELAKSFGSKDLYIGDNNQLYFG